MNTKNEVAERLLQTGAVQLRPHQPYTWASGIKSPVYCDNRRLLSFPHIRDYIKNELCNVIHKKYPGAGLVAGVATAGIAWGALIADQLKLPFVYVRPKPKQHGMGNQVEGYFEKGQKTVVIEDLVSTGASSLLVVDILRSSGLRVSGVAALFSYRMQQAEDNFANANIKYHALSDYGTLIETGVRNGLISEADEAILMQWRQDPANWK